MSLDAGSVFTTLGFKVDSAEARAYEAQVKKTAATGEAAEARLAAANDRLGKSHERLAASTSRAEIASKRSAVTTANQSLAVAKSEAEIAKLEKTMRNSGVATKLQVTELDQLTKQHALLQSATRETTARQTLLSKASKDANANLQKAGQVATKTAAIGLLAFAGATIYAVKTAGDFERQMRNVNSIAKLSEGDYHRLSQSVLDLAGETAQAPKVLAEGLYQLVSSGFNANDSLLILRASAKAATAGLTDTATATTAVAAVLNAYRLPATEAGHVSDILFETVNRGVLTFAELSKEIGTVLPFASALGVPLKDVGAAISTMTKEGISAPETMTRIKQAMVSIIKPSKDMKAAIKETGASSGQALIQQRGFQGALEALVKTAGGSKEALSKLFPNIRATGGVLALTGKNARSAQADIRAFQDTTGATAAVFKEQAKGAEFAGKEMVSSLESAAVAIGSRFLPVLGKGARELAHTLQQASKDGSLTEIGQGAEHVFSTLGQAAGDLAGPLASVAGGLIGIGKAIGLADPAELAALAAGFLAFKGATFILPILAGAAQGILAVGEAAAGATSITEFMAALAGAGVLLPGMGLVIAGAAAGFVAFESGLFSSASAAEKDASALRDVKKATEELKDATDQAARAEQQQRRANLDKKRADQELANARQRHKEGKASKLEVEEAENRAAEAGLHRQEATEGKRKAIHEERAKAEQKSTEAAKRSAEIQKEIEAAEAHHPGGPEGRADKLRRLAELQRELNHELQIEKQAIAEAAVSEISRIRQSHGTKEPGIKPQNAQAINQLQIALSAIPTNLRLKFELADQGTMAKLGQFSHQLEIMGQGTTMVKILTTAPSAAAAVAAMRAVVAGVPSSKVLRIIHNAPSAKAAIEQLNNAVRALHGKNVPISTTATQARFEVSGLQGAINALVGKTVTVMVNTVNKSLKFASGRPSGDAQAAIVGEGNGPEYVIDSRTGAGYKTQGPMLTGLSPDEYVIPLEDRYRGRALGLFAMLARDLGVQGYRSGRKAASKGAHHAMPVPAAIQPLALPLEDIESKQSKAKSAFDKWHSSVASLTAQVHTAERDLKYAKKGPTRSKDEQKLREAQGKLRHAKTEEAKHHRELQALNRTLAQAKAYAAKIKKAETEVQNDLNAMKAASEHGDYGAYTAAKNQRLGALGRLQKLAQEALAKIKPGSQYALEVEGKLQGYQAETESTEGEEPGALTAEQERQRKQIEANIALAALTPGLGDDTSAAQQLVSFFESALSTAQSHAAGPEVITELAQDVKNARSNLESLTTGTGENSNPDLQAQITQANERAEVERRRADIAEGAFGVLNGPGDIGAGGATAAAAVTVNQYMLHPGTPEVQLAAAAAAAGGFSYQRPRQSPRTRVGP